jgi:hypothetical protein
LGSAFNLRGSPYRIHREGVHVLHAGTTLENGVRVPTKGTLAKYGLTADEWVAILDAQGGLCPVCLRVPPSGVMATDHFHERGWKKKPPHERKKYVRGICCVFCNRNLLHYAMTAAKAERIAEYLTEHDKRRTKWLN